MVLLHLIKEIYFFKSVRKDLPSAILFLRLMRADFLSEDSCFCCQTDDYQVILCIA
jgi:hypothetical protein